MGNHDSYSNSGSAGCLATGAGWPASGPRRPPGWGLCLPGRWMLRALRWVGNLLGFLTGGAQAGEIDGVVFDDKCLLPEVG